MFHVFSDVEIKLTLLTRLISAVVDYIIFGHFWSTKPLPNRLGKA